tara:strand:+ start:1206 stop:1361 length:156 start_codon:yes stop_codon:yes gene_type:complete
MTQPEGPTDISGTEFIEPTPEWEMAFRETFAQSRARIAREEAEAAAEESEE